MFCPKCGHHIKQNQQFCHVCGASLDGFSEDSNPQSISSEKSKSASSYVNPPTPNSAYNNPPPPNPANQNPPPPNSAYNNPPPPNPAYNNPTYGSNTGSTHNFNVKPSNSTENFSTIKILILLAGAFLVISVLTPNWLVEDYKKIDLTYYTGLKSVKVVFEGKKIEVSKQKAIEVYEKILDSIPENLNNEDKKKVDKLKTGVFFYKISHYSGLLAYYGSFVFAFLFIIWVLSCPSNSSRPSNEIFFTKNLPFNLYVIYLILAAVSFISIYVGGSYINEVRISLYGSPVQIDYSTTPGYSTLLAILGFAFVVAAKKLLENSKA